MIYVSDVRKSFQSGSGQVDALRGVSCRIPAGQCAFIVGPSGSGKSTLLYLLGALDRPTSGLIRIEGADLTAMSEKAQNAYRRDKVGFIFQAFNLISNLTAIENVLVSYYPRGLTPALKAKAAELLIDVGLEGRLQHRPYQMSGGEQQRVAIARALIKDPVLLLGDEPTGELDSKTGDEIYGILRRLQRERQTTLVVVTHDRRFITPDDLVLEIRDGRLVPADNDPTDATIPTRHNLAEPRQLIRSGLR
jgi:putative ABC transport system ATP-binding protein